MSTREWNDLLDDALHQLNYASISDILNDYPDQDGALYPALVAASALETIRPVTMPPPPILASDREAFLAQADILREATVSTNLFVRLNRWIANYLPNQAGPEWSRKEPRRMSTLLAKAALVVTLLIGATGGTAVLSADSLPDSTLYPVKLALEETKLALVTDPAREADFQLNLAERRLQEMMQMALMGEAANEDSLTRLQTHYEEAFVLAAHMPDEAMMGFLAQAQERIQTQTQNLAQTQVQVSGPGGEGLQLANGVLSQIRQQVENGLQEPQTFRWQHGNMQEGRPQENGPCNTGECEPAGQQNQYGQDPDNTGQNGPGCQSPGLCEPAGDKNQYGQDRTNAGRNGPGDGDGVCDNPDGCEPVGDANQHGQDKDNMGHNGPGDGDGICDNPDGCEPAGDENRYGQDEDNMGHNGPGDGDGVCDNPDGCEPVGNENQHGQDGDNTGHNGSGTEDGSCDNPAGCEPVGDENHHGHDNGSNGSDNNNSSEGGNQNNGSQSGQGGKGG